MGRAYDDYKAALRAGEDGRADWQARKSCNYMTAAVEVRMEDLQMKVRQVQYSGMWGQLPGNL